jgi:rhomboid protease GluP
MSDATGQPPVGESFGDALARATQPPRVVPALVTLNVIVFVATALAGAGVLSPQPAVHVRWGSNFGPLTADGEWWRVVTGTFLHFGVVHLALNMWVLWDAGRLAERLFGAGAFLFIYVAAAAVASLASVAWNPWVNSAGASGAIFGVIGALLVYMADRSHGVPFTVMRAHRNSLLVFAAYSLLFGLLASGVDNAAHLGGLATGGLLGWLLGRPVLPRPKAPGTARWAIAVAGSLAAAVALAAGLRNVGPEYRAEQAFRGALDRVAAESRALLDEREQLGRELREGLRAPGDVSTALEGQSARWEAQRAALAAPRLAPEGPLPSLQAGLVRYATLQRDVAHLMAEVVQDGQPERMEALRKAQQTLRATEADLEAALEAARQARPER